MVIQSKGKQYQKPMRTQSTCRHVVTNARLVLVLHLIGREGGVSFLN